VNRRFVARCIGAYVLTAVLGVPVGWALARPWDAAATSVQGVTSLGAVVPAPVASVSKAPVASVSKAPAKDDGPHMFTMTGAAGGLTPGRWVTLPVLIGNPNSQSIKVLTIVVTPKNASAACPAASNLAVVGYDSTKPAATVHIVPGRGTLTVPLSVQLLNAPDRNQNACKGVTFALSYAGTAMQWGT
jgi:hypothetical protein